MPDTHPPARPQDNLPPAPVPWLAQIAPALTARWRDHFSGSLAGQPVPSLPAWLALLNTAAAAPWDIPEQLADFLSHPRGATGFQRGWVSLTTLFSLTFEAAQAAAEAMAAPPWHALLEAQNRILKHAAQITLVGEQRPSTAELTHRARYLQIATQLNRLVVDPPGREALVQAIPAVIRQNLGYDYAALFMMHQTRQTLSRQSAAGDDAPTPPAIPVSPDTVVGRAAATGQVVLLNQPPTPGEFSPKTMLPQYKAQLAVPMLFGRNLVGVLHFASRQEGAFGDDDGAIAPALAQHVALLLESDRLATTVEHYHQANTLLYESTVALGVTPDLDRVLTMMTRKVAEAVEAGACVISKIDPEANTITALAQYIFRYPGNPSHTWRQLNQPLRLTKDPVGQQVFKTGRPVVGRVNGVKKNSAPPAWSLPAPSTQKPGWGLVFALPLEIDRRVIGLLEIYHKNPQHELSTEAVQLCRVLATQTTMAMEQARLFEETRQRLSEVSTLYTLAQEISGKLDLQTVLDTIVVSLRQAMGCRGCCIFLLDETGQQLEIKAADGLKPHWRQRARLKLGEGIAGRVAADGRPVYVPDTRQDSGFVVFDEDVRSLLVIPLLAYGEVIGTINVDDDRADAFDRTQERLLTIAAAQAGIVIANARLFAQISAEQQQTRAIIQFMADGLLLINGQGIIITCNQTLAQMLGLHSGQIVGQKVGAPDIHPSLAQITAAATRVARTGVLATDVVLQAPHPKTLRVFATTVVDENHRPLGEVRVVHDVTRDREMEQLKDDFFSTMSHELRTPLFSIQGFAQILLEEGSLDGATRTEFLSTIQRQAKQLSEMVNNLLDFSKFEQGKLELDRLPVNLADLIHQTILKLQGYAHQERVKLVSKVSPTLPAVPADGQRLEQVLTNLIGNAIKFSHPGDEVRVSAVVTGKTVKVAVRDQGIGIPPHDLEQIFQPYYQADRQGERSAMGSGLGLHIAKKIIKAHHGHIWVESKAGQGSTFYFTLPL